MAAIVAASEDQYIAQFGYIGTNGEMWMPQPCEVHWTPATRTVYSPDLSRPHVACDTEGCNEALIDAEKRQNERVAALSLRTPRRPWTDDDDFEDLPF